MPYELIIYKRTLERNMNLQKIQSQGGKLLYETDILE